jgi:P27 family predicted phage terminase small subunit
MDPRAREVWDRQIESMAATGVLTVVDGDALRAYCEAVSRYEQAARLLASSGPLVKGARTGELVKNPLHQVARDNAVLIRLFARELGFVPAGREGIRPAGLGESEDDFDRWLTGTG